MSPFTQQNLQKAKIVTKTKSSPSIKPQTTIVLRKKDLVQKFLLLAMNVIEQPTLP